MKTKTLLTIVVLITTGLCHAAILTVDNNTVLSGSPGQYSNLQSACTDAFAGDTILVVGSPTSYGGVSITKKLTLLGPGFNPNGKQTNLTASASFTLSNGSSNTFIAGFTGGFYCDAKANVSGIIYTKNRGEISLQSTSADFISNFLFFNNIIEEFCALNFCGGITLANNIFCSGCILGQIDKPTVIITNNLFLNASGISSGVWPVSYTVICNNVFYEAKFNESSITLCSFNNNLTYNCVNDNNTLPFENNVGSGNIINQDPVFLSIASSTFAYTNNYLIHSSSPCKNTGTDGTDIGPSGGSYPFTTTFPLTGMPAIPIITQMQFNGPSSVAVGNNSLNVTVKGKKQN